MSTFYSESSKMCDVISDEPSLLQLMSRFGIPLGVGELTVNEVCENNKVDTTTFLAVANFMKHGRDVVEHYIDKLSVSALIAYLSQAHNYFLDFQLPNIRRKLLEAIDCSQQNEVAYLILKFYDEYMSEVRRHMQHENSKIFTYVNLLLEGKRRGDFEISQFARSHSGIDKKLQELKWTGNGIQLRSFCERLVLTAKKRMIDEVVLQNLYDELFPHVEESHGEKRILVYRSQETDELEELLERFHGNRKLVAEELGISTTTLWRRMKKYGIEANYGGNELL